MNLWSSERKLKELTIRRRCWVRPFPDISASPFSPMKREDLLSYSNYFVCRMIGLNMFALYNICTACPFCYKAPCTFAVRWWIGNCARYIFHATLSSTNWEILVMLMMWPLEFLLKLLIGASIGGNLKDLNEVVNELIFYNRIQLH